MPLAGKYRLIDIPISNSINSGLQEIYVLTQFRSTSLNTHIARTYTFDMFSKGHVEILAAEQTELPQEDWFQGTADAVRKSLSHMSPKGEEPDEVLILSGDHLYRMDYQQLLSTHRQTNADITVSCLPVTREQCEGFGVMAMDAAGRVTNFREKPKSNEDISDMALPDEQAASGGRNYLASMGVYVFRYSVLKELLLRSDNLDFGKDILPGALSTHRVSGHLFDDYWEDIGTIRSFYEANLALTLPAPLFKFYHPEAPIYTRPRFLPPTTVRSARFDQVLQADGCIIDADELRHSVIGHRARISEGTIIRDCYLMGADFFEEAATRARNAAEGRLNIGIGPGCTIEQAIIDKNARIGANCIIRGRLGAPDEHHDSLGWSMVDGIAIIHKNASIPEGTRVGA